MRCNIGDVVIDRTYQKSGGLGIVIGTGITQPIILCCCRDNTLGDYFSTWDGLEVIGHIDLDPIWKQVEKIKKAYLNGIKNGEKGAEE